MNNSDFLKFDYTQPVGQLPHNYYKIYCINERYGYELFGVYDKKNAHRIPQLIDQMQYPMIRAFEIIGRHKDNYDDILDFAYLDQPLWKKPIRER